MLIKKITGLVAAFIVLMTLVFPGCLMAQRSSAELSTTNNRARRAFEDAIQKYNLRDINSAEQSFRDAVRFDPNFIEAYIVWGEMLQNEGRHNDAITPYRMAVQINPGFFPNTIFYLAECYLAVGDYENAKGNLNRFLTFANISDNMRESGLDKLARIEFALDAIANPVSFEPINLGQGVNSIHDEYAPTLTADEQTLIFTRKRPREDMNYIHLGREFEDFFVSYRVDGEWQPAFNLGPPINTQNNEGAQSISADGMHLYFTACSRPGGLGSCDIYYAQRVGDGWSQPVNLGSPVNTSSWESQPSISPDGKTLYFTSNRQGNIGRMDIWVTTLISEGRWSAPQNLGPVINTTGKEMSPFIHPDNKTLFFASDGHLGMGGMDLFYTTRGEDGEWQEPINLGYPINTYADEISLVVGASGKEAYFASEQEGGKGGSDIYFFELYEQARPTPVTYMKGFVFDARTRQRLEARFDLIDLTSGTSIVQSTSNRVTGDFLIPIPVGTNLALNVWRDGYLFFSENFAFDDVRTGVDPHLYDIPLQPIREGESVVLRNIFFRTDSHELLPESMTELKTLISLLTQNAGMKIEIGGHTDNTGSFAYNKNLSERRALSVYNYLLENGIAKERISYSGYADQKPIATNDTEEGRAQNRRTEFKVLSNN
jgi:outer membrane protein OmpA-like peptidoglycan-associated protein/Tol biopolymer transport system component